MIYVLAILFPCIALLVYGRFFMALLLFILHLTLIGWIPAAIIACFIISNQKADQRHRELMRAARR